ncbi:hypothetical protein [Bacillus sp. AK031]
MKKISVKLLLSTSLILSSFTIVSGCSVKLDNETVEEEKGNDAETEKTGLVTIEHYNLLKKGMSYEEVVDITGSEGDGERDENGDGIYIWDGEIPNTFMSVSFKRDKLTIKENMGLR